jgi:lipopolysaccharide/colanic/teichoic acid biosynthesis glycosyltransferase
MDVLGKNIKVQESFLYLLWKSVIDRPLALLVLIVLSPLMAIIAVLIRLDSPGLPIFRQERVGENGRRFALYKFRTMFVDNDDSEYREYVRSLITGGVPYKTQQNGRPVYKIDDDARVTRLGEFLRGTNLDELPQLLNVLKGEMSCVGPRPDTPFAIEMYQDWHLNRLSAIPGITGLWQVSDRSSLTFDEMVRLDIQYINNWSPLLDCRILLLTARVILARDGSHRGGKERDDG